MIRQFLMVTVAPMSLGLGGCGDYDEEGYNQAGYNEQGNAAYADQGNVAYDDGAGNQTYDTSDANASAPPADGNVTTNDLAEEPTDDANANGY
jgi:hypothetical protein